MGISIITSREHFFLILLLFFICLFNVDIYTADAFGTDVSGVFTRKICNKPFINNPNFPFGRFPVRSQARGTNFPIRMYVDSKPPTNNLGITNADKDEHRSGVGVHKKMFIKKKLQQRPPNFIRVESQKDFNTALSRGTKEHKMVIVRFFANWCKTCRAMEPRYRRLVVTFPDILFLDVPVTSKTQFVLAELGVESVPYGHVYIPEDGLVEKMSIKKKNFSSLVAAIKRNYTYSPNSDRNQTKIHPR
uniref:Thioredoxin domain-containing protein n=1 Tax=Corethron hystrix TaxID=216773 RepID=A0A7S1BE29_9STRA|mmetsp:Transcript_24/g.48  ORF Transcript_24/g.48 Transcript_24/m.48 type:complete len:247 (+) Transcript_24:34-774(+)